MTRLVLPLSIAALLAACAEEPLSPPVRSTVTSQPVVIAPAPAVTTAPAVAAVPGTIIVQPNAASYRPGSGVIEALQTAAQPNAAAGGPATHGIYRLTVRMSDGSIQMIDQDSRAYNIGDRITLTSDGHVMRP